MLPFFLRQKHIVGWGTQQEVAFGGGEPSIKAKLINLINAVRTLMRSKLSFFFSPLEYPLLQH